MKMIFQASEIISIDISYLKYTMPCFDKLSLYYETQKFIPKSYTWYHPRLIKNKEVFDFINIYGDHRLEGSKMI
tara:strand:- start:311 stop:532 length:222 start_codon:yes stop_codon:yes gene_type:complete